jgi:hypothetical protein
LNPNGIFKLCHFCESIYTTLNHSFDLFLIILVLKVMVFKPIKDQSMVIFDSLLNDYPFGLYFGNFFVNFFENCQFIIFVVDCPLKFVHFDGILLICADQLPDEVFV